MRKMVLIAAAVIVAWIGVIALVAPFLHSGNSSHPGAAPTTTSSLSAAAPAPGTTTPLTEANPANTPDPDAAALIGDDGVLYTQGLKALGALPFTGSGIAVAFVARVGEKAAIAVTYTGTLTHAQAALNAFLRSHDDSGAHYLVTYRSLAAAAKSAAQSDVTSLAMQGFAAVASLPLVGPQVTITLHAAAIVAGKVSLDVRYSGPLANAQATVSSFLSAHHDTLAHYTVRYARKQA